jgi:Na+/H+ antiporter NhaD/arsenite permease-like protein
MNNLSSDIPRHLSTANSYLGIFAIITFILAYIFVVLEETIKLKKSKPVLLASGIIWVIVGIMAKQQELSELTNIAVKANILEYAELLLFLIVAMTYIASLEERQVFNVIRAWLINKKFSLRKIFWITGSLAFCISPIADNLTTALLMSTIVTTVAPENKKFICCACINIVVAANAGGAFSPFGDLTTLMVWQSNKLKFLDFFSLFIPSIISFIIPALLLSFAINKNDLPSIRLDDKSLQTIALKKGATSIVGLFLITIFLAVSGNYLLNLPPVIGMMIGFGLLCLFNFYLTKKKEMLDIFKQIKYIEWDTLLFFYGILMCIGGLHTLGYLEQLSSFMYHHLGNNLSYIHQHTPANILIGMVSAILDNIPLMFAVIAMDPNMSKGQWLLVTLTLGIGGSLLSIGSAAGIAIMGQTKGIYNFFSHLKWSWAILLGYIVAIYLHFLINSKLFV